MIYEILPWVLSAQSALMLWLMGDRNRAGPWLGLLGQILWAWYILGTRQWGLVPGVIVFAAVNARNCWKWRHRV